MGVEQGGYFDGKSLGVAGQIYNISTEAARVLGGGFHDCMQATELFRLVLALGLWPQRLSEDGDTVPAARVSSSPTIDMALP